MPLKTESAEDTSLNLTPMIDVVFLLIIFFMVGTRFAEMERDYEVNLPSVSDAQPLTTLPDELIVNVLKDGRIVVNDQQRSIQELESQLQAARTNYPDQSVTVRGDGTGPYQNVMNVLAVCQRVDIKSVALAYRLNQEGE